ncbi:MAG: hypothetical protein CFE32_16605 [Alphaproteobacteria bacterium PA3]|nr:MAG: hypothetical protein CFE32_16605 [Alphaproteobacteria bacterium PA3]
MNRRTRPRSADEQVNSILKELPWTDEQRALIASWRQGGPIGEQEPDEAQYIALALMRSAYRVSRTDVEFDQWALAQFANARFDWKQAIPEAVLHRLADTPADAVRYIEERDNELSRQNSENAKHSREKAQDWWSQRIQDCLEDDILASSETVINYLLGTAEVEWRDKVLRHIQNAADPISRASVRSRMASAKKRISRES